MQARIEDVDVVSRVEALREAEWQARQPILERFRSTPDERKQRAMEGPIPPATLSDCAEGGSIQEIGEAIEKLCREGLRFERWLDTLSPSEIEGYRRIRQELP